MVRQHEVAGRLPGSHSVGGMGEQRLFWLLFCLILVLATVARALFINSLTFDVEDCVLPWFQQLSAEGYSALGKYLPCANGIANTGYAPPYYYLLWVATFFDGLVPALRLIKIISFVFDLLGAFYAFKIMRLRFGRVKSLAAPALVLLAPTVVANSAWWGQSDMLWVSMLMAALYYSLISKLTAAIVFFGIGFAFKAHAIYLGPYLFMLFLRGEVRFWQFLLIPVAYAAMMLPAVLLGMSWQEVLTVYFRQGNAFQSLSLNAPNLYFLVSNSFYREGVVIGLLLTSAAALILAYLPRRRADDLEIEDRLLAASMFAAIAPFLLPKMHDRYFFAADMFTILLAFYRPRYWLVPIVFQISSFSAYVPVITYVELGKVKQTLMLLAITLNLTTVTFLVYEFWRRWARPDAASGERAYAIGVVAMIIANLAWIVLATLQNMVAARFCPKPGAFGALVCGGELPLNLARYGVLTHWTIFFVLLAFAAFAAHVAVACLYRRFVPLRA